MAGSSTSIWLRLAQSIGLLGDDGRPVKPAVASKSVSAPGIQTPSGAVESAASKLQDMLQADPSLKARLHIVSLAEFRDSVGDKWPRLVNKVGIIVEQVIRRHIGAGNPFCQEGEDSWILAFPNFPNDEARRRTQVIVEDLGRHLFGEKAGNADRPLAVAAEVAVADVVSEDGELNALHVRSAVDDRRACGARSTVSESDNLWRPIERSEQAKKKDEMAWEVMESPTVKKPPAFDPNMSQPMPAGVRLSLLWRPTWVATGEAISAYGARVVRVDGEGAEPLEGCRAYPPDDPKSALILDRFVVANAVRDIVAASRGASQEGEQSSVIIPISWSSLASDQRGSVIVPFSELTQETRNTRLVVEIFNIPDGTSTPELEAVVSYLRSLCREVLVRTRISAKLSSLAAEIGVSMVGLDLSELRQEEKMDDENLLATMDRIHEATTKDGIGCYLWSARRRRVVGGLVQSGFEMVNGPGLMKDIGRPAIVVPAPRSRFVAA